MGNIALSSISWVTNPRGSAWLWASTELPVCPRCARLAGFGFDGKSKNQADVLIGDAVVAMVDDATQVGKPISIEQLDFSKKKAQDAVCFQL